jgi:O-antigen ligase
MIKGHWFLGVGTRNFPRLVRSYGSGAWFAYAHNLVLQLWAENGILGMLLGVYIIGLVVFRWIRALRMHARRFDVLGTGASFLGIVIGNLTNSTIWMMKIAVPFWFLAGVILAMHASLSPERAAKQ